MDNHVENKQTKRVVVIGAGPAGLTAAYELLKPQAAGAAAEDTAAAKDAGADAAAADETNFEVIVLEESDQFGGISRTVNYKGNRMDMGGHRFFSKVPEVNAWWDELMPRQGSPAKDDRMLDREVTLTEGGPDPETEDRVMLRRSRVSRILFNQKFFDYPISLKVDTFRNMGLKNTIEAGCSYLAACVHQREEHSLEDFYINRFGKKLYSMFFEHYTENLWGRHPSEIDPSWGAQRVKGVSITAVLKNALEKQFGKKDREVETSLIEEFSYPKLGPGQMWDITAQEVQRMGGTIVKGARVVGLHQELLDDTEAAAGAAYSADGTEAADNTAAPAASHPAHITSVTYVKDGREVTIDADIVISSMPIKDLAAGLNDVPADPARIAAGLPYRDYMTLGVLVRHLNLKNQTDRRTVGGIVPDNWVYVHDRSVKMGRFQIYNNWSPYMVEDLENTVWIGLEYFCNEGDELWSMTDKEFSIMGMKEMKKLHLITGRSDVIDCHVERVRKAYPAYFDTYEEMDTLREYLDTIGNLYCVGRNGQHRYNNIDHSMCTSFEAVRNIRAGSQDHANVWAVNTEKSYHENTGSKQ